MLFLLQANRYSASQGHFHVSWNLKILCTLYDELGKTKFLSVMRNKRIETIKKNKMTDKIKKCKLLKKSYC